VTVEIPKQNIQPIQNTKEEETREFILEPVVTSKTKATENTPLTEKKVEKVVYDLNNPDKVKTISEETKSLDEEIQLSEMELKKLQILKNKQKREEILKSLSTSYTENTDDFKTKNDVPAYLRHNVKLDENSHSSEKKMSKFSLDEDGQILNNNKFFDDKPD